MTTPKRTDEPVRGSIAQFHGNILYAFVGPERLHSPLIKIFKEYPPRGWRGSRFSPAIKGSFTHP